MKELPIKLQEVNFLEPGSAFFGGRVNLVLDLAESLQTKLVQPSILLIVGFPLQTMTVWQGVGYDPKRSFRLA
jgi:hypothetical protein